VLPETATTVSHMVTIISRSLHNNTEFSKVKEVGIGKQIWCCEQIATRFNLVVDVGGDRMVGPLGKVISPFRPTSRKRGRDRTTTLKRRDVDVVAFRSCSRVSSGKFTTKDRNVYKQAPPEPCSYAGKILWDWHNLSLGERLRFSPYTSATTPPKEILPDSDWGNGLTSPVTWRRSEATVNNCTLLCHYWKSAQSGTIQHHLVGPLLEVGLTSNGIELSIVLPETATTVSHMVTIISRSLHNDTEFSKVKEVGITKLI